jgi:hypothetical protein
MKFLFMPISIALGLLAGLVAKTASVTRAKERRAPWSTRPFPCLLVGIVSQGDLAVEIDQEDVGELVAAISAAR